MQWVLKLIINSSLIGNSELNLALFSWNEAKKLASVSFQTARGYPSVSQAIHVLICFVVVLYEILYF